MPGWLSGPKTWLAGPQAWLAGPQAWLAGPQAWLAGWASGLTGWASGLAGWPRGGGTDGRTDVHNYTLKISSFYRTLSPMEPLPKKVEQGKGTADHLMPLGYLLL